ncbi:MAG TPA: VWA domain-containing protein [Acidobacteria bacterium]|nr:VWA domain-containing protein [Acidobacteriota bacterium]
MTLFKRMMTILIAVLAGPGLVLAGNTKPYPTPKPIGGLSFADETTVTVVNVDVFVRDKKGNPVESLTKDDFRIFQDGTPMPITNFAALNRDFFVHAFQTPIPGVATPTPAPEVTATKVQIKPIYVIIYIDNMNLRPLDRNRVLRAVKQWVRENLHPPVHIMVVSYNRSLKVELPFTQDIPEVISALEAQKMRTGGRQTRDSDRNEIIDLMNQYIDEEHERPGAGSQNAVLYNQILRLMQSFADEESSDLRFALGALQETIQTFSGLPGRKMILYVSDGLPMAPGADLIQQFASMFQNSSVLTLLGRYDRSQLFRSLAARANSQGVAFYTIDAAGLQMQSDISAENRFTSRLDAIGVGTNNYQDSLRYLANETGGQAIVNTNNFHKGLEKFTADLFTYYSLGYTITTSGGDRIHRIKVEIPDHPEYKLRYRRRYVEKSLETRVEDMVVTGLVFDVKKNPMQVDVTAGTPAPASADQWTVPIHVSFPLRKIAMLPEGDDYVGRVVLFVAARDHKGDQSDLQRQEHEVRIPAKDYEKAKRERFGIDLSLLMKKGGYNVSVGLMDQITRQASYKRLTFYVGLDK